MIPSPTSTVVLPAASLEGSPNRPFGCLPVGGASSGGGGGVLGVPWWRHLSWYVYCVVSGRRRGGGDALSYAERMDLSSVQEQVKLFRDAVVRNEAELDAQTARLTATVSLK